MMGNMLIPILLLIEATGASVGGNIYFDPQYRPMPIIGGGYSDKKIAGGHWRTRGFTVYSDAIRPGAASHNVIMNAPAKAAYRLALLAKAEGYRSFQIVDGQHSVKQDGVYLTNANATLEAIGTMDIAAPLNCRAKKKHRQFCQNHDVDGAIVRFGAMLGQSIEMAEADLQRLRTGKVNAK
jgi:hypothetical protein